MSGAEITIRRGKTILVQRVVPPGEYIVGQAGADFVVADETVAAQHVRLTVKEDEVLVEDLGSVQGTFISGQKIEGRQRLIPTQKVLFASGLVMESRRLKRAGEGSVALSATGAALQQLLPAHWLRDQKYEVGRLIAQGGMGAILEARERTVGRTVAMKVMLSAPSETHLARFVEEAQITGQLEHPNIVPVHELGIDQDEQLFCTMKFVRGVTLKEVLNGLRRGDAEVVREHPLAALLTVFQKVCDAVAFAHSRRVIHRDLKPDNIMLGRYDEVLVMDWGLAKVVSRELAPLAELSRSEVRSARTAQTDSSSTLDGSVLGTPHYMAPEQARGEVAVLDVRTDIYSLGVILFEMLHLRHTAEGRNVNEVMDRVALGRLDWSGPSDEQKLLHLPDGRIPDSLLAVCRKALALDPAARYQRVEELQAEMNGVSRWLCNRRRARDAF